MPRAINWFESYGKARRRVAVLRRAPPTGTIRTGTELPLWTGTSDVPAGKRISLPDLTRTLKPKLLRRLESNIPWQPIGGPFGCVNARHLFGL
jgi:hypothetical protein